MTSSPKDTWNNVQIWLTEQALPLWSTTGFDSSRNVFQERLDLAGNNIPNIPRRLMVQARQIYVYSTASQHGWIKDAADIVTKAADSMIRDYFEADGEAGWVFSIDEKGKIIDPNRDLYSHAFAMFGLAAAYKTTRNNKYLDYAHRTILFLDTYMTAEAGGYVSSYPSTGTMLQQDPHMHLLESLMALHDVDPNYGYDARATYLVRLFTNNLFQFKKTALMENFDMKWKPLTIGRERFFEPGHHCQWAWLLDWYQRISGTNTVQLQHTLSYAVTRHGVSPQGYLLWEEVKADGTVLSPTFKFWPHAEAIKSSIINIEPNAAEQADMWLEILYTNFLKPAFPGGWFEKLDLNSNADTTYMPASAFYHIVCALSEYALRRPLLEKKETPVLKSA